MRWYEHLYVGEKAVASRYRIIQKIRRKAADRQIHVITPASNGNNILDIYSATEFARPHCQERNPLILGIAADYWEALSVAARIVDEMYRTTGGFSLEEFLRQKDGERLE